MLNIGTQKIYVHRCPVDMRKGFHGLSILVDSEFSQPLLDGGLFVFVNSRRNLMKILYWDGDGLALWYKRLERGSFNFSSDGRTELSRRDFSMLLEGIEPRRMRKRFSLEQ
jgi:transposase